MKVSDGNNHKQDLEPCSMRQDESVQGASPGLARDRSLTFVSHSVQGRGPSMGERVRTK